MGDEQKSKNSILDMLKRAIPGTTSIDNCEKLANCVEKKIRICGDIKVPCIRCYEEGNAIGGLAFPFGIDLGEDVKSPIVIYRYGQADSYATMIKGENFDNIVEKFEKDENIKEITEKTQFIRDEKKEAEKFEKIEAFKRSDANILVTRKNKRTGEYEDLDLELIAIAKEKEEKTGIKIHIVDETELNRTVYLLGVSITSDITQKKLKILIKNLEREARTVSDADERIFVHVSSKNDVLITEKQYRVVIAIASIEDDILENDDVKNKMKEYFLNKYKDLCFISTETYKEKNKEEIKI